MKLENFVDLMATQGMSRKDAVSAYEDLESQFDGDWKKVGEYVKELADKATEIYMEQLKNEKS